MKIYMYIILKPILTFFSIITLFFACSSDHPPHPLKLKSLASQSFQDNTSQNLLLKDIVSLKDSAKRFFFSNEEEFLAYTYKALDIAKSNALWIEYLNTKRFLLLTWAVYFKKIDEWKIILNDLNKLSEQHKEKLKGYYPIFRNGLKTQWGLYYAELGLERKAIEFIQDANQELQTWPLDSAQAYHFFYNTIWLGEFYKENGSFEKAIQQNKQALIFFNQNKSLIQKTDKGSTTAGIYLSLGYNYLKLNDLENASHYYQLAEESYTKFQGDSNNKKAISYYASLQLITFYLNKKEFDQALLIANELINSLNENNPRYIIALSKLGDIFMEKQYIQEAISTYRLIERLLNEKYSEESPQKASLLLKLAEAYQDEKNIEIALQYCQKAIKNVLLIRKNNFDDHDIALSLNSENILNKIFLMDAFKTKANIYLSSYQLRQNPNDLQSAQQQIQLALEVMDMIKANQFLDKDRYFQIEKNYEIYETGLAIASKIYEQNQDPAQLEIIFQLMERSKNLEMANNYSAAMVNDPAMSALLEEERIHRFKIAKREEALAERNFPLTDDPEYLDLQKAYDDWLFQIKTKHPEYLELKKEPKALSIKEVQKQILDKDQVLIEYFWGQEKLYALSISKKEVHIHQCSVEAVAGDIRYLRSKLQSPKGLTSIQEGKELQELLHHLYNKVVAPNLAPFKVKPKALLIIPDALLTQIPFESLDMYPQVSPGIFNPQDFLINKYNIHYANSATLLSVQNQLKGKRARRKLAAFAPHYLEMPDTNQNLPIAQLTRAGNYDLLHNKEEVKEITAQFGGKGFLGGKASERAFKEQAPKYNILHFAMHAIPNHSQPGLSELLFSSPNPDPSEDGRLRALELYNMQLNARLVVLSACSTGFGHFRHGQGVLSLGHAFSSAGVPSLVTSLWNVNDEKTKDLMIRFYHYLDKGKNIDEALRLAKLDFLDEFPELAHPYYWSAFVSLGNKTAVK